MVHEGLVFTRLTCVLLASSSLVLGACGSSEDDPEEMDGAEAATAEQSAERDCKHLIGGHCIEMELEDTCGLDTGYEGDIMCLKAPAEDEGFQMHIGPDEYTEEAMAQYVLPPGEEGIRCVWYETTNEGLQYYYERAVHMRPVSHHLITSVMPLSERPEGYEGGWAGCGDTSARSGSLGGSETVQAIYPANGVYPPEFSNVGRTLPSNTVIRLELHYINATDKDLLREMWMNVYYKPIDTIEDWVADVNVIGGYGANTGPGEHTVNLNSITLTSGARIVSYFGHYHAHTTRISIYRERDGERTLALEDYDWFDPKTFNYDTITDNPVPDRGLLLPGASTGILDYEAGDKLYWECEVVNDSEYTLKFADLALTGEMCNVFGEYIGGSLAQAWSVGNEVSIEEYEAM